MTESCLCWTDWSAGGIWRWNPDCPADPGPEEGPHPSSELKHSGRHLDRLLVARQLLPRKFCSQNSFPGTLQDQCQGGSACSLSASLPSRNCKMQLHAPAGCSSSFAPSHTCNFACASSFLQPIFAPAYNSGLHLSVARYLSAGKIVTELVSPFEVFHTRPSHLAKTSQSLCVCTGVPEHAPGRADRFAH